MIYSILCNKFTIVREGRPVRSFLHLIGSRSRTGGHLFRVYRDTRSEGGTEKPFK